MPLKKETEVKIEIFWWYLKKKLNQMYFWYSGKKTLFFLNYKHFSDRNFFIFS